MPIFRVKSVKIYTGQKKLHGHVRGDRDKYEVCSSSFSINSSKSNKEIINRTLEFH